PIAGQIVIAVLLRQRFAHRQQRHDLFQQFDFQAALDCPLVVLFESGRVLDGVLCFPHFFRSANNSSRSLYPFTDGSFAILSASSMAAIVSLLGCSSFTSKGMPPSRSDWRTKILNAVVRFMPSSLKRASACAFKSASMRMLMFVVFPAISSTPFCWYF